MRHPQANSRKLLHATALALAVGLGLGLGTIQAQAATLTVNSTIDNTAANDGYCTLREAIVSAAGASNDCGTGAASGPNTIQFDPSLKGKTITVTAVGGWDFDLKDSVVTTIDGDVDGDGHADITLSGNHQSRVLDVYADSTVTLENLTIIAGNAPGDATGSLNGGSIYNSGSLTLKNAIVTTSQADNTGGGIYNIGALTMIHSSVTNNTSRYGGGIGQSGSDAEAIINASHIAGNSAIMGGGGIATYFDASLTLRASTVSGNTAGRHGGGLVIHGPSHITNSTVYGNHSDHQGGGILVWSNKNLELLHSTISGNMAETHGGGIYFTEDYGNTVISMANNLISGNTGAGSAGTDDDNCATNNDATIQAVGANLFWPTPGDGCNVSSSLTGAPDLGPLRFNGGPTRTLLPGPASMAVDTATCSTGANAVTMDQRGLPRGQVIGSATPPWCDFGAVEVNSIDRDRIFADGFE